LDEQQMTATCVFSTSATDRVGDIVEPAGINTFNHQANPVIFLEHGLFYQFPIGKSEDAEGNYTVQLAEDYGQQTTYFSQSDKVAEQCFQLIAEGVLKGNSLRYEKGKAKRLPNGGLHVIACDLVEISWTPLPCNQECVTTLLQTGQLGGKALHSSLKSLLAPYAIPKRTWINGANMEKAMSSVDQSRGGALRDDEENKKLKADVVEEESHDEPEEAKAEPMGASVLRDLHGELKEIHSAYSAALPQLEQPKVKSKLEKCLKDIGGHVNAIADTFASVYSELEQLERHEVEEEAEEADDPEDEEKDDMEGEEGEEDMDEPEEEEKKSRKSVKYLNQLLSEETDGKRVKKLKSLLKLCEKEVIAEPEPEPTLQERKALEKLERAIARKEALLRRNGVLA